MEKIMFNDDFCLTESVLEKLKTQTRRIEKGLDQLPTETGEYETILAQWEGNRFLVRKYYKGAILEQHYVKPKFKVGEYVAIAQRYRDIGATGFVVEKGKPVEVEKSQGWRNKMFVNAGNMPHHIRITDVRLQRLKDITDEECLQEGVRQFGKEDNLNTKAYYVSGMYVPYCKEILYTGMTPREAYAELIDRLSGKGTWESNPWVLAYSFELIN